MRCPPTKRPHISLVREKHDSKKFSTIKKQKQKNPILLLIHCPAAPKSCSWPACQDASSSHWNAASSFHRTRASALRRLSMAAGAALRGIQEIARPFRKRKESRPLPSHANPQAAPHPPFELPRCPRA